MKVGSKLFCLGAACQLSILPAISMPQWVDIGKSKSGSNVRVNYNSLRRDGNRVGFTLSIVGGESGYAAFTWVDCSSWQFLIPEGNDPWRPIAADTVMDFAATFACKNSTPNRARTANNQAKVGRGIPAPKGRLGKCTFLPYSGGKRITDDSCRIDRQGSVTTLYWSDNVFTRIEMDGDRVEVFNPDGAPFAGSTVARSSIGGIIKYEKGTIGWCWTC